jgi:hypothetical protein
MFLYRLKTAGYPFAADDLLVEEWMGIAEMSDELEIYRMESLNHGK